MKGSLIAFNRYTRRGACGHARVHGHHDHVPLRRINWRGRRREGVAFEARFFFFFFSFCFFFFFFFSFRKPFTLHCAASRTAGKIALRARRGGGEGGEFFLRFAARGTMEIMLKNERWGRGEIRCIRGCIGGCNESFMFTSVKSMKGKGRGIEVVYFMKTWPRREGQWRNL